MKPNVGKFRLHLLRDLEAEARLADLSLTDQRNQPIGRRVVRHVGDRGLSADQFGYALGEIGRRAGRGGNGQRRRHLLRAEARLELADLAGELIALPGNRLDQLAVRPEGLAQRRNLVLQPVFRPDPAQQLVLADHSPRRLEQRQQQVEGASAEPYRLAFGEELAAMRQDAEVAELDDRRRVGRAKHDPSR